METITRLIPLTQGKFATVSAEDYDYLNQWKWYAVKVRKTYGFQWYARRNVRGQNEIQIYMHHEVAKRAGLSKSREYDHKNRDGLENTRLNVRACSHNQNNANRVKRAGTSSRFKGVYWHKRTQKWMARIKTINDRIYLGEFCNEQDAANAYAIAARKYFGEFARF